MFVFETYIAKSTIHGLGVFTNVAIKKGTVVWRFEPSFDRMLTREQFDALPSIVRNFIRTRGFFDKRKNMYFLGGDFDLFSNHSDEPNLVEFPDYVGDFTPDLIAARDIAACEELTSNYGEFCGQDDLNHKLSGRASY
jgi:hypothetical protein